MLLDEITRAVRREKTPRDLDRRAPHRVYEELLRYDFSSSRVTTLLMTLRGYGRQRARAAAAPAGTLSERLARSGFTLLAEKPGKELVFGLIRTSMLRGIRQAATAAIR